MRRLLPIFVSFLVILTACIALVALPEVQGSTLYQIDKNTCEEYEVSLRMSHWTWLPPDFGFLVGVKMLDDSDSGTDYWNGRKSITIHQELKFTYQGINLDTLAPIFTLNQIAHSRYCIQR